MKAYILEFKQKSNDINNPITKVVYGAIEYRKIIEFIIANKEYKVKTPDVHWWWKCYPIELDCPLANNMPKIMYDETRYYDWNGNDMEYEPIQGYII